MLSRRQQRQEREAQRIRREQDKLRTGDDLDFWLLRIAWAITLWQWRFFLFTGLWAPFLVLMLDVQLKHYGVPGETWGLPFTLSVGFALVWTSRNLVKWWLHHH